MKKIMGFTIDDTTLYTNEIPDIPVRSPFGHLGEKYIFLMYRIHFINDTVEELYQLNQEFDNLRKKQMPDDNLNLKILHRVLRFSSEIKVIIDEMISLYYILDYQKSNCKWPSKIQIDSIGRYLDNNCEKRYHLFDTYSPLLEKINSIGNAVKHSFVNSEITWLRNKTSTPLLFAYHQKQNDLKHKVEFHYIELPSFINDFNNFLNDFRKDIKSNYSQSSLLQEGV